jgi:putative transposase
LLQRSILSERCLRKPRVSNDNAFSESQFRILKYCPQCPQNAFTSLNEARLYALV